LWNGGFGPELQKLLACPKDPVGMPSTGGTVEVDRGLVPQWRDYTSNLNFEC